jgi:hypothetical protein
MALRDPAQREAAKAQKEASRAAEETRKRQLAFQNSPQGRARAAWQTGAGLFQVSLPVATTQRTAAGVFSGDKAGIRRRTHEHTSTLDVIEAEGWRLEHASYVFEQTGSVSRDKMFSSGQTASVTGQIIGIYIFRAREERDEETASAAEREALDE